MSLFAGIISFASNAQCTAGNTPTQIFSLGIYTVAPNSGFVVRQICSNTTVYDTIGGGNQKQYYMEPGASLFIKNAATTQVWMRGNSSLTVITGTMSFVSVYKEAAATTSGTFTPAPTTCSAVSFPTVSCTLGINQKANEKAISVFPNPASDHITIINDNAATLVGVIINKIGQKVKTITIENGNKIVDVSDLAAGIYFLNMSEKNKMISTQKIIITK